MKQIGITGEFTNGLDLVAPNGFKLRYLSPKSYDDIRKLLTEVDYYILGGPEYLSRDLLSLAKSLKAVAVMGTGTPSFIDLGAAAEFGITVYNVPSQNAEAVAEFAHSILYVSQARVFQSIEGLKERAFWYQAPRPRFQDSAVGLIGLGACSKALIQKLKTSGITKISYYSRTRDLEYENMAGITYQSLEKLVQENDLVSIHVSYNSESENLIDESVLKNCRPSLQIFNFSNPKVVNAKALKSALEKEQIAFFFLDGYYQEWVDLKNDPQGLLSLPARQFVATSHIAAQLAATVHEIFNQSLQNILSHAKSHKEVQL